LFLLICRFLEPLGTFLELVTEFYNRFLAVQSREWEGILLSKRVKIGTIGQTV